MRASDTVLPSGRGTAIPFEIYSSLVDALYDDRRSLFIGSLSASLAALITAWKSGHWVLLVFGIAIALVAYGRALDMQAYWRVRQSLGTDADIRRWEHRYVAGAAVYAGLLGCWTFACFLFTNDAFIHLFSFAVTLAYMIGTSGRNFASPPLVVTQLVGEGIPMSAALLISGGLYFTIFGLVLVPFFVALKFISDRLRRTLLDAVIAQRDMSHLAKRFDTALNNMPHGLGMFDAGMHLVVANQQLAGLLEISPAVDRRGTTARELVLETVGSGLLLRAEAHEFAGQLEERLSNAASGDIVLQTANQRTLNFTFQPMENRGSVMLVEDITERIAAEARIRYLARYDALTGLPNRSSFRDRLDSAYADIDRLGPFSILFVDLDQFKQVNDTLGHPRGDALLCMVADRLRSLVGPNELVARFGGDEFVLLLPSIGYGAPAASMAERIIAALSKPYDVDGHQVVIGATIGIAIAPRDGADADLILKNADMALYWAKAGHRGSMCFFDTEMDIRAQARRSLELDLRSALASGAFEVYYQPLYDLKTKRISTCEALLRWPHPVRGMISPAEFIPVAEEMGLIVEIGNWVLKRACADCSQWPNSVRVAVNISANQLRHGSLVEAVNAALAEAGLPASRLEIEITESVLFQDTDISQQTLAQLRDRGVRISLDDFGTGYSSLSYLHSLPLNKVKIDRSFLEGIESRPRSLVLLSGIARLSAELGLSVTVEGIETEEQLALVASERCIDEAQGFLFSPAIPMREISRLLGAMSSRIEKVA
jgi:diguanylate cyclase (GGDEF)-like protein